VSGPADGAPRSLVTVGDGAATGDIGDSTVVSRRAWIVLFVVSIATFQSVMSLSIMNVAMPDLQRSFPDVAFSTLSWVIGIYAIAAAATLVLAGALGDRIGRKKVLLAGVVGFGVASVACALAPNVGVLLGGRVVQAVSSALITPTSAALIVREFPPGKRSTAVGMWSATGSVAAAVGPSLGAWLVDWGSWRWAFWLNLPGTVLGVVFGAIVLRESRDPDAGDLPDVVGALLLMLGVSGVVLGVTQSSTWGWGDARVPAILGAGVALLAGLVLRCAHHPRPVLDLSLFRVRSFTVANLSALLFGMGFFSMFFGFIQFLTKGWGYSTLDAGLLLTPVPAVGAVLSAPAGSAADRYGPRPVMMTGGALYAAGALWLWWRAGSTPELATVWFPALVLMGAGAALAWPALFGSVVADIDPERYGVATGINQTLQRVSTALGTAIAVVLIAGHTGPGLGTFWRVFALSALGGLAGVVLGASMHGRRSL
jgi:EmrB/QacA subfamily drug resistance transporter